MKNSRIELLEELYRENKQGQEDSLGLIERSAYPLAYLATRAIGFGADIPESIKAMGKWYQEGTPLQVFPALDNVCGFLGASFLAIGAGLYAYNSLMARIHESAIEKEEKREESKRRPTTAIEISQ